MVAVLCRLRTIHFRAVGEGRWRTCIQRWSSTPREPSGHLFHFAFEVPRCGSGFSRTQARAPTSTGTRAATRWQSGPIPREQRVLGVRQNKDIETGLLISVHRDELASGFGWVYSKYKSYFDPDPSFDQWMGRTQSPAWRRRCDCRGARCDRCRPAQSRVRWEELTFTSPVWHDDPTGDVKSWEFRESPHDITVTRDKVSPSHTTSRAKGVGTFVYST